MENSTQNQSTTKRRVCMVNIPDIKPENIRNYIQSIEEYFKIKYANCADGILLPSNNEQTKQDCNLIPKVL